MLENQVRLATTSHRDSTVTACKLYLRYVHICIDFGQKIIIIFTLSISLTLVKE